MKKIITLSLIIGFTITNWVSAQELTTDSSLALTNTYNNYYVNTSETIPTLPKAEVSPKLRNMGIGLTALGITTIFVGSAMVKNADGVTHYNYTSNSNGYSEEEGDFGGAMGALGVVGGSVATIGGVVMWVIGQKKLSKNKNVSFNFTHNSMYFAYQF